jgi:hypothetical protein
MILRLLTYLERRKERSYTQLWEMLYGDGYGHDKGYIREYNFAMEVASMWRRAYENEKRLRKEAEKDD